MLCINSPVTNPYYQLAVEEYLLRNAEDDFFMLWQSDPVVVSGKHQNVLSEINYRHVQQNGIQIARRLTGGGTVFHDHGNLNFSFIRKGEQGKMVDFSKFLEPVISYLKSRGIPAEQGPKHEILVNDLKVSGNAEHVYKNRVLHHGTLLIHSDLDNLRKSIHRDGGVYTDKAVQSNRARVVNLSDYLDGNQSAGAFKADFFETMVRMLNGKITALNDAQDEAVQKLAKEKFGNPDWIFGWSPDYSFRNTYGSGGKLIIIELATHRGRVVQIKLASPEFENDILAVVNKEITGKLHCESQVRMALQLARFDQLLKEADFENLVYSFF